MSQSNKKNAAQKQAAKQKALEEQARKEAAARKTRMIVAGLVGAAVLVLIIAATTLGGSAPGASTASDTGSTGSAGTAQPTAEEEKYIGRLLPAGYAPIPTGAAVQYQSVVEMAEIPGTLDATGLSVPLSAITGAKLALVRYQPPGKDALPLIAYVKPSGDLFVGVSFCPPCQGEWQTIQPDGTLTCNSCGTKRDLQSMAGISGACKLYPLDEVPATLVNGNIVIDTSVLDSWTPQPLDRQVG